MKKGLLSLVLVVCLALVLGSCTPAENADTYEIAVVTDIGQLNDGGFNQGTYQGAVDYATANGKTYKYYQPANGSDATDNDRMAAMRLAIENGAKVIVTPGFLQATAIQTVAKESPDVKFIFIDGWTFGEDYANVTSVNFLEQESAYFAGYAAVMDGYTSLGGTFGGAGTSGACNRFAVGYLQGINDAAKAKDITVDAKISFQYGGSYAASPELQTQISGWYGTGTQIVFACGGSMLQSVKAAAEEGTDRYIIGVDVDQHLESERIITSAVKGLASAVAKVLGEYYDGKWDTELANKTSYLGVADNATGLPTDSAAWRFKTYTVAEYNTLFEAVKAGTVTISIDGTTGNMSDPSVEIWATWKAKLTNVNLTVE